MSMELHTDLLGEHLTICTLQGLAIDQTTGVISNAGTAVDFAARVLSSRPQPPDHRRRHPAGERDGHQHGAALVSGRGLRVQVLQDYDEAQVDSVNTCVSPPPPAGSW